MVMGLTDCPALVEGDAIADNIGVPQQVYIAGSGSEVIYARAHVLLNAQRHRGHE